MTDGASVEDSSNAIKLISMVTSQLALLTALLYYFGWVYAHSFLGHFGVDPNLAGYSIQDYILRSIHVAFYPFIAVTLTVLIMLGFHHIVVIPGLINGGSDRPPSSDTVTDTVKNPAALRTTFREMICAAGQAGGRWQPSPANIRWLIAILQTFAVIFAVAALVGVIFPTRIGGHMGLLLPLSFIASVTLLGYIAYVRSEYPKVPTATTRPRPTLPFRSYVSTLLSLGMVAGLWAVSLYGDYVGSRDAIDLANHLSNKTEVVIYSAERIALQGPGLVVSDITQSGSKYHYKYTGLRLLTRSPGQFLLIPSGWKRGHDHAILLRENDSIRVDFIATP